MATLADYMGGRYARINYALRALAGTNKEHYDATLQDIGPLESELFRKPVLAGGTRLYRRCGMLAVFRKLPGAAAYAMGDTFADPAFLSTSRSNEYERPQGEGQLVAVITCAAKSRGHDVADVRGNVAEAEVLFERGTRFEIKRITTLRGNNVKWELLELSGT